MTKFFYLFSWKNFLSILTLPLFISQMTFSQTWIRKVDGFSMWSIGKDYTGNIYAGTTGTNRGIFKSTDGGDTWTNVFSTGASNYLSIACDSLNNVYIANASNGLLISTDGGQNFTLVPSGTFNGNTLNTVSCGKIGHIFVGATNGGVWRSTDFGATFTNTALQTFSIVTIAVDKFNADIIYAGASSTSANGFFISTDDGLTFGTSTNPLNVWEVLQTSSNDLYIATTSSPYTFDKSTDGGLTWNTIGNQPAAMRGATLDLLEDIYISGNGGVFKSSDGGASFANHNLTFSSNKIITYDNKILVCVTGTTNGGVWIFTDSSIPVELSSFEATINNGNVKLDWSTATELNNIGFELQRSINNEDFAMIAFIPGFGTTSEPKYYSYTDKNAAGFLKYRLKQIDFDGSFEYSQEIEAEVLAPLEFSLEQNYPNPFNPSTKISWYLPVSGNVTLRIFNAVGKDIKTLVDDEFLEAGSHSSLFIVNSSLPSGVYFYQLKAGSYIETKKMILLK